MDKHIIGENAGKLWRLLSTDVHRKWTLQEVKDATGFNDLEAASAIAVSYTHLTLPTNREV